MRRAAEHSFRQQNPARLHAAPFSLSERRDQARSLSGNFGG
jgi:hypothetical protein